MNADTETGPNTTPELVDAVKSWVTAAGDCEVEALLRELKQGPSSSRSWRPSSRAISAIRSTTRPVTARATPATAPDPGQWHVHSVPRWCMWPSEVSGCPAGQGGRPTRGAWPVVRRFRSATRRRGHFPDTRSALKVLYLTAIEHGKGRSDPNAGITEWAEVLNKLTIIHPDRITIDYTDRNTGNPKGPTTVPTPKVLRTERSGPSGSRTVGLPVAGRRCSIGACPNGRDER